MANIPAGRRMYNRYETNSTAWVRRVLEQPVEVLMENLSARGAAIIGYEPFGVNDTLTLLFDLPFSPKRRIRKQAHVAWCAQVREGVWETGLDFGLDNMLLFPAA
ncbi:MAG TPA: PilZ domain-containing protein [Candidatus Omnitrophota bacterium]|nr:PilZ domain-containing protein [Candidatus Omnitrophota bacterium]HQJ14888.1 PilZ domain-containing protein [Candidatus Omnitrophota bacterium]